MIKKMKLQISNILVLQNINNQLDLMKCGVEISFDDFLKEINVTEEHYIIAIQYSLKRDTLFLKRSPTQIRINNYNVNVLNAWRANMDIQFVLDPYASAVYILSYLQKAKEE